MSLNDRKFSISRKAVSSKAISNLGSRSSRRSGVRHPVDVGSVSGEDAKHLARKRGLVGANRWHRAHDLFASRRHATGPLGPPRISQATSRYATAASIPATFSSMNAPTSILAGRLVGNEVTTVSSTERQGLSA